MPRWIAIFEDNAHALEVREKYREPHFQYLATHASKIRLGGGLQRTPEGPWVGGLWIIDADTREEAVQLCKDDPFFVHGLRKGYSLMLWSRAPGYGEINTVPL